MGQFIYCYDAYCSWCYGFSPVIAKIHHRYKGKVPFEVLSGGMIRSTPPKPISIIAEYNKDLFRKVEDNTGVRFGSDYLWHIFNPEDSDWFPDSLKPAVAMSIFKEEYPDQQIEFAGELQYALFGEGRDLCDNEAYRHLLEKYSIDAEKFFERLKSTEFKDKAEYEFSVVQHLQVTGYPALFYQQSQSKFHLLAQGYTEFDVVNNRIENLFLSMQN
ncbi:MAG: DsbA family protein [Chitinophagaceae bacterium]|nr:MAG: DsbA family protein [Chitinophagaceae bacterium]